MPLSNRKNDEEHHFDDDFLRRVHEIQEHIELHRKKNHSIGFEELIEGQEKLQKLLEDFDPELAKFAKANFN